MSMKKMAKKGKTAAAPKAAAPMPVAKSRKSSVPRNRTTLSYTQSEFMENIMGFCGLRKRAEARGLIEDLSSLVKDTLKKGYKIPFFGLGKMYVRKSKARIGRNPATGEPIQIPARKRIRFSASKALKEAVL
jgi:DNA-binding protein HU-beta